MEGYSAKDVEACIQDCFSTPSGRFVLQWLIDVHVMYKAQSLLQGGANMQNLGELMAYRYGKQDLVIELKNIYDNGLVEEPVKPNYNTEDDTDV